MSRTYTIRSADRAAFDRCRRQWDFSAKERQDLEPVWPEPGTTLAQSLVEALAVYYFPGMWDWPREVVLPIVEKAFDRAAQTHLLSDDDRATGLWLVEAYAAWAPRVDRFSPVRVDTVLDVHVPDLRDASHSMTTRDGRAVMYRAHVDVLVTDERERYWAMFHRIGNGLRDIEETARNACWAWEQSYPGIEISGALINDIDASATRQAISRWVRVPDRRYHDRGIRQHGTSGGGRGVPRGSRSDDVPRREAAGARGGVIDRQQSGPFMRTVVAYRRADIGAAATAIAVSAREMLRDGITPRARLSKERCAPCAYRDPCIRMNEGLDASDLLAVAYAPRLDEHRRRRGRLGAGGGPRS